MNKLTTANSNPKTIYLLGVLCVTAYNILAAASEVYIGNFVQKIEPFYLVFLCFIITALFFNILQLRDYKSYFKKIQTNIKYVIFVNLSTTLTWLSFFISLKYIEPAIVATIDTSIVPIITLCFAHILRRNSRILPIEIFSSIGIFITLIILVWASLTGRSAVGTNSIERTVIGIIAALICGAGIMLNSIFSKRLNDSGWLASSVMAVRFFLLILCSFGLSAYMNQIVFMSLTDGISILLIVFAGTIIPLYLLQLGIEYSEPIVLSLLLSMGSFFTLLLQAFDSRLVWSPFTTIGVFAVSIFAVVGILSRHRSFK
jgi:drug/metabolite transporter (DMT)-like permease